MLALQKNSKNKSTFPVCFQTRSNLERQRDGMNFFETHAETLRVPAWCFHNLLGADYYKWGGGERKRMTLAIGLNARTTIYK
jgi:hypothetical protein